MSRAPVLGEITLRCGPSGAAPEGRLRFTPGRLNVFIGPNNAGKSLMLRELSGQEPRTHSAYRKSWLPGRLVEAVDYGAEVEEMAADEAKERCLTRGEEVHDALRPLPWRELIRTLQEREATSTAFLEEMRGVMVGHPLLERLPVGARSRLRAGLDQKAVAGLVGSLPLLKALDDPTVAEAARALLDHAVHRGLEVLSLPGVELSGLRQVAELDLRHLVMEFFRGVEAAIQQDLPSDVPPNSSTLVPASALDLARLERLSRWVLEPRRWADLRADLERRFLERSWGSAKVPKPLSDVGHYLDGLKRLEVTSSQVLRTFDPARRDDAVPVLLDNEHLRNQLRAYVHDALGQWLVVDMVTDAPHVHLRLSRVEPTPGLEQRRDQESATFLAAAELLAERSDGIHAYIGILAAILTSNARLVFIDEPEAFLHPSLARTLGRQIADLARRMDIQIFIATHSPDLLAGCVTGDSDARVVRLSYLHGEGRAWRLDNLDLRRFTTDPRLRSASALSGLFTQAVVIGEGDSDRVFYQEIFERLNEWTGDGRLPRRAEGWTFTNLQNWQTEHLLLAPLRQMGVPAVAVVDRDVLFATDPNATTLLLAAGVPQALAASWRQALAALRPDGAAAPARVDEIVQEVARYGVFVVPKGSVEDWLTPDVESGPKKTWVERAFLWLGLDPSEPGYRRPEAGGVWDFMREIAAWVDDPLRLGMSIDRR